MLWNLHLRQNPPLMRRALDDLTNLGTDLLDALRDPALQFLLALLGLLVLARGLAAVVEWFGRPLWW